MTKTEIIAKIEDLFEQLRDNEYSSWCNRSTITSWYDSYEYTRYRELWIEEQKLIDSLESNYEKDTSQDPPNFLPREDL